jgi:LL-diaminopimelate aminotransferase
MKSDKLLSLPPYLFEELENRLDAAVAAGKDVVDLSVGDPDLDPPRSLKRHLVAALDEARHDRYPPQRGLPSLKKAVRKYLAGNHGVEPADDEMLILIGSKEGLAHLPLAVCNPGDEILIPDPGYPVYEAAALFAGCRPFRFPLAGERSYLPDLSSLAASITSRTKMIVLNYPNNPTSASSPPGFFGEVLDITRGRELVLVNDAAYADVYSGEKPEVLSSARGALEANVIEFFSFSKTFCITGWRIGFAVGNKRLIDALAHLKANIDSGVFGAIQEAVEKVLGGEGDAYIEKLRGEFGRRRRKAVEMLEMAGIECYPSSATFYVWCRVPGSLDSYTFALELLDKAEVLVTPGSGFGKGGEGFFRIALTESIDRIEEACRRISAFTGGR